MSLSVYILFCLDGQAIDQVFIIVFLQVLFRTSNTYLYIHSLPLYILVVVGFFGTISSSNPLLEFPQVLFANPFEWLKRSLSTMPHKPPKKIG